MPKDPLIDKPPCLPQHDLQNILLSALITCIWNMIERRRMLFNFTKNVRLGGYPNTMAFSPTFLPLPPSYSVPLDNDMYGYALNILARDMWGNLNKDLRDKFSKPLKTLQDYADATGILPKPKLVAENEKNLWGWLSDQEFVRQRLQGLNPEMIALVTEEKWEKQYSIQGTTPFNIDSAIKEIDEFIGQLGQQDFRTALQTGNIYVCDYTLFALGDMKALAKSFNRYIAAPIALFYRNPHDRILHPIAIQLFPGISQDNPVFVPDGSMDWLLAKIWVNSVDGQYLEVIPHLYESHLVAEIFQVSLNRQLGSNHPIYQLLHPHFFATLFINQTAREGLLSVNGPINVAIAAGVPGAAVLINKYMQGWNFLQRSFVNSLKNRGFEFSATRSQISGYFWEEDGLKIWAIIKKFVRKVLDIFYKSSMEIENDFELQQWISELESPHGGDLQGVSDKDGKITTIEQLTEVLTNLIWICTAKHSSGNIEQYNLYGFVPNVPGALYLPPPTSRGKTDAETILAALPPQEQALGQIAIVYLLSDTGAHPPQLSGGTYPGLDKNAEASIRSYNHIPTAVLYVLSLTFLRNCNNRISRASQGTI